VSGRRIAVIGSGVSGLVAARELHRAGHDVSVFEAGDHAGGHTNTITVEGDAGEWEVDTGFIVLNDRNYPNFERLLSDLGVTTQPANMSFSVSDDRGAFEWASRPRGVFAQGSNLLDPRFHRMLLDLFRFWRDARGLVGTNGSGPTLRAFLEQRGYSEYFVERLIVPQVSAIWSADPERLWSFPASFLAEFMDNHGNLQLVGRPRWRSIPGGSRRYVEAITAPFRDRIHLRTPVRAIRRRPDSVDVTLTFGTETFDEVVIAAHADQALAMLADATPAEREILSSIAYQPNEAVLHTDESLLPRRRGAWASWNFHLGDEPTGRTTVTYHMNRLQSLVADREFLVTLNRTDAIDPQRVIRRIAYSHPVYTAEGVAAQGRWDEISGRNRTHYCGAYWRWGFHEDGVWSGLRVSERLGALERDQPILAAPERARAA
jgi:predicted NAD/FAD-binding protein